VHINHGYRVDGPYTGGLHVGLAITLETVKFLGVEHVFQNALTGMPKGGATGGADFNRRFAPTPRSCGSASRSERAWRAPTSSHFVRRRDAGARSDLTDRPVVGTTLARRIGHRRVQASNVRLPATGTMVWGAVREAPSTAVPPVLRQLLEAIAEATATALSPVLGQMLEALAEPTTVQLVGTVSKDFHARAEPPHACLVSNGLVRRLLVGLDVHDDAPFTAILLGDKSTAGVERAWHRGRVVCHRACYLFRARERPTEAKRQRHTSPAAG